MRYEDYEMERDNLLGDIRVAQAVVCGFARDLVEATSRVERDTATRLIASTLPKVYAAERAYAEFLERNSLAGRPPL